MIAEQLNVMFFRQSDGFGQKIAVVPRHHLILLGAEQPGALRIEPLGHVLRIDLIKHLPQLIITVASRVRDLAEMCRIARPVVDHTVAIRARQHQDDRIERIVHGCGDGGDETAEACALQRNALPFDLG